MYANQYMRAFTYQRINVTIYFKKNIYQNMFIYIDLRERKRGSEREREREREREGEKTRERARVCIL